MEAQQLYLTTDHIRANCRTGHERGVVPDDTIALTCGADVNFNGLHVSIGAEWPEIDSDTHPGNKSPETVPRSVTRPVRVP